MNQHCQWNQPQSSTRFAHQRFLPQATHRMKNYSQGFRRQQVQQCRNCYNPFQSFYSRYHKKNQNKKLVMEEKNQKSSNTILPLINHTPAFKNIRKQKTKQVWILKTVFDSLTCSLAPKFLWVLKLYL